MGEPKIGEVPQGWKQVPTNSPIIHVAYRLPDSKETNPEFTITSLAGGGGLLENSRRWEQQLGLKPSEALPKNLKTIKVAGEDATYIELLGPEGKDQRRMLVVIRKMGETTWYFKLLAPADVVARLNAATREALADPALQKRFSDLGLDVAQREQQTPEGLAAFQKAEIDKWWPIIKSAGIGAQAQ